jgi:hypothetical protein
MKLLIGVFILMSLGLSSLSDTNCQCTLAKPEETTRWGGNRLIAYEPVKIYKSIRGEVVDIHDVKLWDVLVEVFDRPEYLLCQHESPDPSNCTWEPPDDQRRIAACVTGKDGKFCFENIPPGKYELRVSRGVEWNVARIHVEVTDHKSKGTKEDMVVEMSVGD